jgi:hypothetical protein
MEQEIWKEIPNSKFYAISNFGRVKRLEHSKWCTINQSYSIYKEKILTISFNNSKKYGRIGITYLDDNRLVKSVHRLVAESFIENPFDLPQINHKDGIKTNNHVSNLEWCTQKENMQHRMTVLNIKNWKKGEESKFCKLTEQQVLQIPNLLAEGKTKRFIAKLYKVCPTTITEITAKRSWKHLNLF